MLSRTVLPVALVAALALVPASASAAKGTGGAVAAEEHSHAPTVASAGGVSAEAAVSSSGGTSPDTPVPAPALAVAPAPAQPVPAPAPILAATGPIVAANVPFGPLIATTARRYGIPASLLTALVWQESGFRERARSKAGARGLTQLMPGTARDLGVRHVYDPAENLDGGARYLRGLLLRFGSVPLALAGYNAGPENVKKHRGIPPFKETRQYVRNVMAIEARLRAAGVR